MKSAGRDTFVLMVPLVFTSRMEPESVKKRLPAPSTVMPDGPLIAADVAGPPSPLEPATPLPAKVVMLPSGSTLRIRWFPTSPMKRSPELSVATLYGLFMTLTHREWVLVVRKVDYRDSLTGTFINRNHFAAFLALHLYALAGQSALQRFVVAAVQVARRLADLADVVAGQRAQHRRGPVYVPRLQRPFSALVERLSRRRSNLGYGASLMRVFLPYLVWNTVFDNTRVVNETGRHPAPFSQYSFPLLKFSRENRFTYKYQEWPSTMGGSAA